MNAPPPDPKELSALLRLLDDETPEVRSVVSGRLAEVGGDISEILPGMSQHLKAKEKELLSMMLQPARRQMLRDEWITPGHGVASFEDDWELFESHLRLLSDFLHDGLSLRAALSDALDMLADEAGGSGVVTADDLREFLFESGRLKGNSNDYYNPSNSDLAWCIEEGRSNPIGLAVIYMLVAQRMGLEVEGVPFPGHFLCRIFEDGYPLIVDCYEKGRIHIQDVLTDEAGDLDAEQRLLLQSSAHLGSSLFRMLDNLMDAFNRLGRSEDADLIADVRRSMSNIATKG